MLRQQVLAIQCRICNQSSVTGITAEQRRTREEGREGRHDLAHSEQHVEERGERDGAVLRALAALEALAVVAHVHVGEVADEAQQVGHHRVKPAG